MPTYTYLADTKEGERMSGIIDANSPALAAALLGSGAAASAEEARAPLTAEQQQLQEDLWTGSAGWELCS